MAEATYYVKFFGNKGSVTFRGESGWTAWTSLSYDFEQKSMPNDFNLSRDEEPAEETMNFLAAAAAAAKEISMVEIVAMRPSEVVFHLIMKDVSVRAVWFRPDSVQCEVAKENTIWKYPAGM